MLRISKLADAEYLIGQVALGIDDYYMGVGEAPGVWQGGLADQLGLSGVVDADQLRALNGLPRTSPALPIPGDGNGPLVSGYCSPSGPALACEATDGEGDLVVGKRRWTLASTWRLPGSVEPPNQAPTSGRPRTVGPPRTSPPSHLTEVRPVLVRITQRATTPRAPARPSGFRRLGGSSPSSLSEGQSSSSAIRSYCRR
jgi:hypothetical protein